MTTKSLEELFYDITPKGLGKYAGIIEKYGTSLKETRKLVGELGAALKAREYKFLPSPVFMTEKEAAQYGIELAEPLPEGWLLKLTPIEGKTPTISFMTPEKWEIRGEDEYISPEGKTYTKEEMEALMAPPSMREYMAGMTEAEATEFARIYGEQELYRWTTQAEAPTLPKEKLAEIYGAQELYRWTIATQYEAHEALREIFPEETIVGILSYADTDPEGFVGELREAGRTEETETILKLFGATEAEIGEFFGVMPAIPREELINELIRDRELNQDKLDTFARTGKKPYDDWDPETIQSATDNVDEVIKFLKGEPTTKTEAEMATRLRYSKQTHIDAIDWLTTHPEDAGVLGDKAWHERWIKVYDDVLKFFRPAIPEIPTEGLEVELTPPVYAEEAPESPQTITIMPDYSVIVEGEKVGSYDPETGQFIPPPTPVWQRILTYIREVIEPFGMMFAGVRLREGDWSATWEAMLRGELLGAPETGEFFELRDKYRALPWWEQLLWETPLFIVATHGIGKIPVKGVPISTWELRALTKVPLFNRFMGRLGTRAYNKWLIKEALPAHRKWLVSQGLKATPADEAFVRYMTQDTLSKFVAAYTGRQIAATPGLAQKSYADFVAQYGSKATGMYQSQGMTINVAREIKRHALKVGDKSLADAASKLILRFERGARIEATGEILIDKLATDFIIGYEASGGKVTQDTVYNIMKLASKEAEKYFPLMYTTDIALQGADATTHTIVMNTSQNIMTQGIAPASITPQLVESFAVGQTLSMTLSLLQALKAAGFSEEAIQLMSPSEAWANLLRNVTPVPAFITGEPPPPMEAPATYEGVSQPPITEITIPPTEDIINASVEPNLARTLFRAASNLPGGENIVRAIDPRALVPHVPETISDAINKNAIVWREINKIGQGVKAVKLGSLSGITTNAAKMFGFNTNALSIKMINRLLPQYKGTVEAGTLEHVFTHPEMYNWTGFRKGFEYVTKVHKINTEVLNLLRAEGVAPENVTEDWWIHRVVEGKYDANGELIEIRGRPGMRGRFATKRAFDMHRKAPTMYEGMSWKIKYSEHPELSVSTYIEEAYRKIANARFYGAVDKDLEAIGMAGKLPTELLKERFPEIFERAETTAERAKDLGNFHKVVSRAVRGEVPTTQTLNAIQKRFPELGRRFRELVQEPATEIKQLRELLNESQKAIRQLESQLKAKEIKPETITPQAIPDELKLAEAFGVMSYEDRLAFRSTMDDQLEELARTISEHEAELGGILEFLKTDPVATYRGHIGKRSVSLLAVLKKGQFPETFTIKEAQLLMMGKTPKTVIEGRVPRSVVVDELADHFKMTEQQLIDHIENVAVQVQTADDLKRLVALVDGRLTDIKRMLAILNKVDVKPEHIPQLEPELPLVAPEVVPEAPPARFTEADAFEFVKRQYAPYVLRGDTLDSMKKGGMGYYGPDGKMTTGAYFQGEKLKPNQVGVEMPDGSTYIFKLEDIIKSVQEAPPTPLVPKAEVGMPEAGLQKDMFGYTQPVFPAGKGVVTQISMDEYNRLIELRKAAGLEGPPPNVAIKPAIEGISKEPEFAKVTYEIPKIKTVNERKAGLEALRKEVKVLAEGLKPEYWRARYERAAKMEAIREAPGIGKGYIMHPHFGGKIYDQEFIDAVNKFMGHDSGYKVLKFTSNAAGILRVTKAAMDFSFMGIQGLPAIGLAFSTMATNPIKGAKMMAECIKATVYPVRAVFDPEWMYRYLGKMEAEATQRNSFGGSSVAVDFFEKAKALGFIPGKPYERFELAFFGAGELIRNPFWEAMKEEAIRTGNEFQLARFLDRLTGIISTEAMGVPVTIRQLESSFVWFAPRYTRACLTLLANCFRGGYTGAKARRALGGMVMAGVLAYSVTRYGISKLQGKSDEECWHDVLAGFGVEQDPITKEWGWKPSARIMSFKIGNYYMGIGGFWYGLLRLAGNIMATVNEVGDRERIDLMRIMKNGSFNKRDNPFIYWWFSRSSPLNSFMFEAGWPLLKSAFSGELQAGADFFGYPIETWQEYMAYMITRFEPIWMEQGLNPWIPYAARDYEIPEDEARIVVPIVELFGMRSFPEGGWTIFYDRVNELLTHLPEDVLKEYFTEDELVKILEAQEGGKLNWSHLPKPLQQRLLNMYPELKELYDKALGDSGLRGSGVWKQWEGQVEAEKTKYYDYGNNLVDRLIAGEIDTRELRGMWSDAGSTYGSGLETIEATPFYKLIYDYFEQRQAEGVKYDWKLSLALQEYTSIMFADYLDANGDMDWDARDRAVDAYIEEWGEETYEIIRQMYADKKLMEGLSPILVRLAEDKNKLGREYWQLPWKPIIEMDEVEVPAEFHSLWKQYQALKTDAEREAFLKAHPDLGKDWRAEFRKNNPETDAMLALWGYGGRLQTREAYDLVSKWSQELGVPLAQMGLGLPSPTLIDDYFGYIDLAQKFSGNSAEAKLWRLEHPQLTNWAMENWGWEGTQDYRGIEYYRMQIKWRTEQAEYDALEDKDDRDQYLANHPEYRDDRRRLQAMDYEISEDLIENYVEYYSLPEKGHWRDRYRLENPDFDKAMIEIQGLMPIEPDKIKPEQYDQIYLDYQELFDAYDNVQGTATERDKAREKILKDNPEFAGARLRRNAYGLFVPENLVESYAEYYSLPVAGYDQERFLKENKDYYNTVWLGILENKEIDFDKVPSVKVEKLLEKYDGLPAGDARLQLRCQNKELDDYLVRVEGYVPCYGTDRCD